jgi:16S rRNA (guanine966-N2)-methyltransferase
MKIIGGKYKSKHLVSPQGMQTRPTLNRIKENLFNILCHRFSIDFSNLKVLDLFAGSGALGIECYSRGASSITFVDNDLSAIKAIQQNTKAFDSKDINIKQESVLKFLKKKGDRYNLVFMDPPYDKNIVSPSLIALYENNWINSHSLIIGEMPKGGILECPDYFEILDTRTYAKTTLFFIKLKVLDA